MSRIRASCVALAAAIGAMGCTGSLNGEGPPAPSTNNSGGGGSGGNGATPLPGTTPNGNGVGPSVCTPNAVGKTPERLLTRSQLGNLILDVFPELSLAPDAWVSELPAEEQGAGFATNAGATLSELHLSKLMVIADKVAEAAAANVQALQPGCDLGRSCAAAVVRTSGSRAYRRELTDGEVDEVLVKLFDTEASFEQGLRQVVRGLLLAADTLYQYEVGQPPAAGLSALAAADLASKLSFFLWDTVPDDELRAAAADGSLLSQAGFDAQVERLMASPRAAATIGRFYREWLHLTEPVDKNAETFPSFTTELYQTHVLGELDRFTSDLTLSGTGSLASLLTASHSFVTAELAALYGVAHPGGAEPWARVDLDPTRRAGILTRVAFLSATSHAESTSPTIRGKSILNQLRCSSVPEPPPDVQDQFPQLPDDPTKTTRQRLTETTSVEARCQGCHAALDPWGLAFEHYDAVGQYRELENGLPIDARVETDLGSASGAIEVSHLLAHDPAVAQCFTDSWFNFTLLREASDLDACAIEQLNADFESGQHNLRQMIVALLKNPAFHYREAP